MEFQNKILTVYSAGHTPENPKIGDILLQSGTLPYKIYDGTTWQSQANTSSAELSGIFSKDENYFYVNYSTEPNIEFVKKWDGTQWNDITSSRIGQLLKAAADAEATADGKIKSYSGDFNNKKNEIAPNPDEGDLFIDTEHQNKLYRYSTKLNSNGKPVGWEPVDDERLVGEGDGITFTPYGGGYNAAVILNKEDGLKITNNGGAYFQATANRLGFYDYDDTPLMYISGGDAYFSGTIRAANIPTNGTGRITFGGVSGSGFYSDASHNMHVSDLTIDDGCVIGDDIVISSVGYLKNKSAFSGGTYLSENEIYLMFSPYMTGFSLLGTQTTTGYNFSSGFRAFDDVGHDLTVSGADGVKFSVNSKYGITVAEFSDDVYAEIASHIGGGGGGVTITNRLTSGTRICTINSTDIYAPSGSGSSSYTLPTASSSTKGGIKVGSGLAMSGDTLYVTSVPTTNVHIESGEETFTGESSKITFNSPFSTLPIITVTRAGTRSNLDVTFSVVSRTDYISGGMYTGFKIKSSSTTLSTTVDWIAVG